MNKILRLSLIALLAVFCGGGVFAQVKLDFGVLYGEATISDISSTPKTVSGITVSFAKGNSPTAPAYNKSKEIRLYGGKSNTILDGNSMTVKSASGNMTNIVLTHGSSCTWGTITANVGNITVNADKDVTWVGNAEEVVFTISRNESAAATSTQYRITSATVTCGSSSKGLANLKFSEDKITIKQGDSFTAPTFTKSTTADVTFTSDNTDVATVDATGNISLAGGLGTAIITATSKENTEYYAGTTTCTIEVYEVNTYKKATAVVNGGKYLLVAQRDGKTQYAMPIASNKTYGYLNVSTIEGLVDEIDVNKKYNDEFVVTAVEGGYTIQDCYDRYLAQAGTYASFQIVETPAAWTIEPQADGTFKISMNGYYIQWGQDTFTTFGLYTEAQANAVMPMLYASEDTPTGITNVVSSDAANENAPIYNLAGQRVNKTAKGILIQNGKKFMNK